MILQLHCRACSRVYCGLKLVNFGLMRNCFGLVRFRENIIGSVHGWGRPNRVTAEDNGALRGRGAKHFAPKDSKFLHPYTYYFILPNIPAEIT